MSISHRNDDAVLELVTGVTHIFVIAEIVETEEEKEKRLTEETLRELNRNIEPSEEVTILF